MEGSRNHDTDIVVIGEDDVEKAIQMYSAMVYRAYTGALLWGRDMARDCCFVRTLVDMQNRNVVEEILAFRRCICIRVSDFVS